MPPSIKLEKIRVAQTLDHDSVDDSVGTAILLDTPPTWPQNLLLMSLHCIPLKLWRSFRKNPNQDILIPLRDPNGHEAHGRLCYVPENVKIPRKKSHSHRGSLYSPDGDLAFLQLETLDDDAFKLHRFKLGFTPKSADHVALIGYPKGEFNCGWGRLSQTKRGGTIFIGDKDICTGGMSGGAVMPPESLKMLGQITTHYNRLGEYRLDLVTTSTILKHLHLARPNMHPSPKGIPAQITAKPVPRTRHGAQYPALVWDDTPTP